MGAFAPASGNVVAPKGLAVRVNAPSDVSFSLFCSGEKKGAKPGVVYVVGVNTSQKCLLNGDATTGSGGARSSCCAANSRLLTAFSGGGAAAEEENGPAHSGRCFH
jgi:hypothetical protein